MQVLSDLDLAPGPRNRRNAHLSGTRARGLLVEICPKASRPSKNSTVLSVRLIYCPGSSLVHGIYQLVLPHIYVIKSADPSSGRGSDDEPLASLRSHGSALVEREDYYHARPTDCELLQACRVPSHGRAA